MVCLELGNAHLPASDVAKICDAQSRANEFMLNINSAIYHHFNLHIADGFTVDAVCRQLPPC